MSAIPVASFRLVGFQMSVILLLILLILRFHHIHLMH